MTLPCCVWNVTRGEIIFCTTNYFTQDIKDDMSVYGTLQEEKFYGAVQATQEGLRYYKRRNERRKYFTQQIILHRILHWPARWHTQQDCHQVFCQLVFCQLVFSYSFFFIIDQLGDTLRNTVHKYFLIPHFFSYLPARWYSQQDCPQVFCQQVFSYSFFFFKQLGDPVSKTVHKWHVDHPQRRGSKGFPGTLVARQVVCVRVYVFCISVCVYI